MKTVILLIFMSAVTKIYCQSIPKHKVIKEILFVLKIPEEGKEYNNEISTVLFRNITKRPDIVDKRYRISIEDLKIKLNDITKDDLHDPLLGNHWLALIGVDLDTVTDKSTPLYTFRYKSQYEFKVDFDNRQVFSLIVGNSTIAYGSSIDKWNIDKQNSVFITSIFCTDYTFQYEVKNWTPIKIILESDKIADNLVPHYGESDNDLYVRKAFLTEYLERKKKQPINIDIINPNQ